MSVFKFKYFDVIQSESLQKIGTDAMVLGAWVEIANPQEILDVGTGTGVIALMLAQTYTEAKITALDIDEKAVKLANENFLNSPFNDRLSVVQENFLLLTTSIEYDLIVSNPPYFNTKMPPEDIQRNLARHEDSMPLKALINHAYTLLSEQGELWLIIPRERTEDLLSVGEELRLNLFKRIEIFGKPNKHVRDVLAFSKQKEKLHSVEKFLIREESGDYSKEYKQKTKDFHYNQL